jgi:hypothetical protein
MQTGIALTFLSVVAEEQFSLDELVLCVRQVMEEKGTPGMLRLILELLDELWAIRATRQGQLPGERCCANPRYEIKDRLERRLRTSVGTVDFKWRRLRCRACKKHLVPMRRWLALQPWQSKTHELERLVVDVVSQQSYRRSSEHLDAIGEIPVPKSTAHRWVAQSPCDELNWPQETLATLLVDGTGFKRRPAPENNLNNKGELRVVIGIDQRGQAVPLGTWTGKSWEQIAQELEAHAPDEKLAEQLGCDGEPGLADRLARLTNKVQRCHWHMVHDLDRMMWFDQAPLAERRRQQRKLSGIISIELPADDFEPVQQQDKEQIQERVQHAEAQLQKLAATLNQKGYPQAATYVAAARRRLFSYIEFWMETGVSALRTTSYLERLMRELGRRLKRMAFGWSESGAAKMARILIKRICDPEQWNTYWKNELRISGNVFISFQGAKVLSP